MKKINKYKNYNKIVFYLSFIIILVLFAAKSNAQARRGHPAVRRNVVRVEHLPGHYETVVVHKNKYFYNNGFFYKRGPRGYAIIHPPIGARIRILPRGYTIVKFGGLSYFYINGAYYNYIPTEKVYVVVDKPANVSNAPDSNLDQVKMNDGSVLEGVFQSGTDSTITINVNGDMREIPINEINSITFAQSIQEDN